MTQSSNTIELFDDSDTLLDTLLFSDALYRTTYYNPDDVEQRAVFNIPYDTYDREDLEYMKITLNKYQIPQEDYYIGKSEQLSNLNANFDIYYNKNFSRVEFYAQNNLLYQDILNYGNSLYYYYNPSAPTGFEFNSWYNINGDIVTDTTPITEDMAINGVVKLYASYLAVTELDSPSTVDPTPQEDLFIYPMLSAFGMDTDTGYILFYVGVIMLIVVAAISVGLPLIVTLICVLLVNVLFTFWGIVPLFVTVIMYVILGLGTLTVMGGVGNE